MGLGFRLRPRIMENQMAENVETDMNIGIVQNHNIGNVFSSISASLASMLSRENLMDPSKFALTYSEG